MKAIKYLLGAFAALVLTQSASAVTVELLSADQAGLSGFTHRITVEYSDLTAAAGASDTNVTVAIFPTTSGQTTPAGTIVTACAMRLVTEFDSSSDASINEILLRVGDGGDTDRFLTSTEVSEAGTAVTYKVTANSVDSLPYAYTSADTIDVVVGVAGGGSPTVDELTSGKVYIFLRIVDLNKL